MKIEKLLAPKQEEIVVESAAGTSTAGSIASVAAPLGKTQRRGKGSMLQGIKTSAKFPNSVAVKEGAYDDGVNDGIRGEANPRASSIYGPESGEYSRGYKDGLVKGKEQQQANIDKYKAELAPYKEIETDDLKQMLRDIRKRNDETQAIFDKYRGASRFGGDMPPNVEELKKQGAIDSKAWQAIHQELFQRGVPNDQRMEEGQEQLDEIFNPSSNLAHFLRAASSFAGDYIPVAIGAAGTFAATTAVLGPVAAMMASSTVGTQILQSLQGQQNKVPGLVQQLVEKYFGSEQEEVEFAVLHAKAAFLGQPEFRWRGKQWPVTLEKNAAEAIVEKNDKYWLEQQNQSQQPAMAEGNKFLQQHGHGGKFPEPRKPRPDGMMSKSEVLGKDGLVYHWQDPRAKQGVGEAKKANTASARAEFGKRPRAELSDKEKEQKKSESDEAWERLMAYAAQADKEKKVDEASPATTFNVLKGLKTWQVVIFNNYYAGKYSDYRGRYYYVLATSPEEAKQVVIDNADGILQEILAMKSQNGKKILPRGTAVRITPERIGKIEDGTVAGRMSTAGFKKMFGPQGPMMVKLSGGAVVDMQGQEQPVDEASFDYTMKDLGNDYAGFPSNHSMKHKFLAKIKPEKQQLYKDKINNTHDWDNLFALFKVAKERGDIIEPGSDLKQPSKSMGLNASLDQHFQDKAHLLNPNQTTDEAVDYDKHSFIGKIRRGREADNKGWGQLGQLFAAGKDEKAAEKALRKGNRYYNMTRGDNKTPGGFPKTTVDEQGVAESAHTPEAFQDIVQRAGGDVRGIYKELQERGLHSEIKEFCIWAKHQGIADIFEAIKLAEKVGLEVDDENEIAYEGYLRASELLGLREIDEEKQRLDPKCWSGYKKQGTKMKGGVRVNNCVPVSEADVSEDKLASDLYRDLQIFKKGDDKGISSKAKDKEIGNKPKDKDIVAKEGFGDTIKKKAKQFSRYMTEPNSPHNDQVRSRAKNIDKIRKQEEKKSVFEKDPEAMREFERSGGYEAGIDVMGWQVGWIAAKHAHGDTMKEAFQKLYYGGGSSFPFSQKAFKLAWVAYNKHYGPQGNLEEMDGDGAGRDGSNRKSHSTYGSRDKHHASNGPDIHLGAEHAMKRKDITKRATDVLNKEFDKSHKDVSEDWQKTNKHDRTDGMSPKAVKAYRRENPGSKLQTAVTKKPSELKAGSKDANRRKSFCARMSGNKGPMKDEHGKPTPKAKALKRWNC